MFCVNCGNQLPEGAKFCPKCGTPVNGSSAHTTVHASDDSGVHVRGEATVRKARGNEMPSVVQSKHSPDVFERFFTWLKEDWLMKLGALLILIAIGWFGSYAIAHNWIGPVGRVVIGMLAGVATLIAGYLRARSYPHQGGILLALGAAMLLTIIFIARYQWDMFDPVSALFIMFITVAFTMLSAMQYNMRSLAYVSVALAGIAPLLTHSAEPSFYGLFGYLAMVTLGSLWVVYLTGWRGLVLENFSIVSLYSLPYIFSSHASADYILTAFAFAVVFFIASIVGLVRTAETPSAMDMLTAFGTGLFIFTWTLTVAPEELQTMILLGWALIFAVGSFLVYTSTRQAMPFVLYGGVAVALVAFATSVEFDGAALTMAYSAEAAVATLVAGLVTRSRKAASRASVMFALPIFMSLGHLFSGQWSSSIAFDGAIAVYLLVALMILTALTIMHVMPLGDDAPSDELTMPAVLLGISGIYVSILIWLIPHALFTYTFATGVSLLMYTAIGITAYILAPIAVGGKYERTLRIFAQIVLAGVALRLIFIDTPHLSQLGRVVVFTLVGVALISTAFIGKIKRGK